MMRSMYSGVSGLRVHQTKMDVIGNNIANVNTVGFKRSTIAFQEIFNQTIKGAGSPQGGRGGTNPQQIGLGVSVSAITVNHSKGATQSTGYMTDLMVDGNGYFILSNDVNAENRFYTRAGNFTVDKYGYLVAPNGYKVLDEHMKTIQINKSETKAATATSKIQVNGNINFNDSSYTTTVDVYDNLGDVHTITMEFGSVHNADTDAGITDETISYREVTFKDESGNVIYIDKDSTTKRYVKFDNQGEFTGFVKDFSDANGSGKLTFDLKGTNDIEINISVDPLNLNAPNTAFTDANGNIIFKQTSGTSDAKGVQLDGNSAGAINDFTISRNGEVVGIFTNGERKVLARIGLADFDNPAGLMKLGSNLFIDSPNSGTPKYGAPSSGSFGDLSPGALEMSNVDLSLEFTDMITAQRGFQANSRIITTTDEMLQELVNLKR